MAGPAQRTERIAAPHPQREDAAPTQTLHVTELLRREGVEYGDNAAEDEEGTTVVPPALAAQPVEKNTSKSRAGMFGKAAVLVGLTVGGLVGLQSTLAPSPDGTTAAQRPGKAVSAPKGIERSSSTTETTSEGGGGAAPTTSADVELRDNATELAPTTQQQTTAGSPAGGASTGSVSSGSAAGSSGDAAAPTTEAAPEPTSNATAPRGDTQAQSQDSGSTSQSDTDTQRQGSDERQSTQSDDDGGNTEQRGLVGDVLDPVTGAVNGVLDVGTGLLG